MRTFNSVCVAFAIFIGGFAVGWHGHETRHPPVVNPDAVVCPSEDMLSYREGFLYCDGKP